MFVIVVDDGSEEIKQMRFVVELYPYLVDHFNYLLYYFLHYCLIIEDVLVVGKELSQQQNGLAVISLPQNL